MATRGGWRLHALTKRRSCSTISVIRGREGGGATQRCQSCWILKGSHESGCWCKFFWFSNLVNFLLTGQTKYMCGAHSGCEATFATSGWELSRVAFSMRVLGYLILNLPGLTSCFVAGCSFWAVPSPFQENQRFSSKHFAILTWILITTLLRRHYHPNFYMRELKPREVK